MKLQRIVIILSIVNVLALAFVFAERRTSADEAISPKVRTRAIELVDDSGKTRATLDVEKTGEVVFRLRDEKGTIRTKFSAGQDGSGLSLMDDRTEATVQIRANRDGGGITLFDRGGAKNVLK